MERLCIMVYELSERMKTVLHDAFVAYAIDHNIEVEVKWLKSSIDKKALQGICAEVQIAFVNSGNTETAVRIGQLLHSINPECRLIYYGNRVPADMRGVINYFAELISSGPIRYLHEPNQKDLSETLRLQSSVIFGQKHFIWENKGMKYRLPYGSIQYFSSGRNYVYIRLSGGGEYSFLGKLSNIESQLPKDLFVRIHQSYLVNLNEIIAVDKQKKTICLRSGEELFISKAHYKETIEACSLK